MRVLIAGGGEVGALLARRLVREGNEVAIIEPSGPRCTQLESMLDARIVQGSAASVQAMRQAGVAEAEMVIAVTDSDEVNLLSCVIAQAESSPRVKIARLRTYEVDDWRRMVAAVGIHIDLIIHPETAIAERIMRVVRTPGVSDILEFAAGRVRLFGMNVEAGSCVVGKRLEELDRAGPPPNSLVVMIFRGQQVIIPRGSDELLVGDHIYVVTTRENLDLTLRFMGIEAAGALRRVFIIGGKQVGIRVARALGDQGVAVKLFERDQARAERIAGLLKRAVVVHADGTDQAALDEAGLSDVDAFLALTNDDEDNVIASLLARRIGVRKVVALVNRLNYLPMVQRLGINATVSPRLSTVDGILHYVRKGRVVSVTTFREEEAEAVELIASEGARCVDRQLRDIRLPHGAIVGAIVRPGGEVVVPRGTATIRAGDRVIFFALERVIPELELAVAEVGGRRGP